MATRDELYAKFGKTAEAAQLFETELGTLLFFAEAVGRGWHKEPDANQAQNLLNDIDRKTLGRLLGNIKSIAQLDDHIEGSFSSALAARNRLFHGFYERHNFKIQTDNGRDVMVADLEELHEELFKAWRAASELTALAYEFLLKLKREP